MKIAVQQPNFMPHLGYFDRMARVDVLVHYDDVSFTRKGHRNRVQVKSPVGAEWITVPVNHGEGPVAINEATLPGMHWPKSIMGKLRAWYRLAPYAEPHLTELERVLGAGHTKLIDLNLAITGLMRNWLGITTPCHRSSELGVVGETQERIIAMCKRFGSDVLVNGPTAKAYTDENIFRAHGIEIEWHDYAQPEYPQQHGAFVPGLSALDYILNTGAKLP